MCVRVIAFSKSNADLCAKQCEDFRHMACAVTGRVCRAGDEAPDERAEVACPQVSRGRSETRSGISDVVISFPPYFDLLRFLMVHSANIC